MNKKKKLQEGVTSKKLLEGSKRFPRRGERLLNTSSTVAPLLEHGGSSRSQESGER